MMAHIEILVIFAALTCVFSEHKHPIPTYFGRLNDDNEVIDASDPGNALTFNFPNWLSRFRITDPSAVLQVSPDVISNGAKATISWKDISKPLEKDIIAFFCPENAPAENYLDYFYVTVSKTWAQGYGSTVLPMFNTRVNCEFRYYSNNTINQTTLVTRSNIVSFAGGPQAPLQGHIAMSGNPTEMRITWVSGTETTPMVMYGIPAAEPLVAFGNSTTYKASDMCQAPATEHFLDPGFIHNVLLTGLKPRTTYLYQYGTTGAMSSVHQFTTAPLVGPDVTFKTIIYGDMGVSPVPGAYETAERMQEEVKNGSEFIIHHGDISYARGYAYIWEQWHHLIEPYATKVPYMVGIGNHEQDHTAGKDPSGDSGVGWHPIWGNYGIDSGGECGVPMWKRFTMPQNGNPPWWYSFDYGSMHVVMMSTEHDFSPGSRQFKWMEEDLKSVDRRVTPWLILTGHRAMYTSETYKGDYLVSLGMKYLFEDLLYKYKVDMAFWAHYHAYERTCPVYKEVCQEGAPVHIVVGTAGKVLDHSDYWPVSWSVYRDQSNFGYGRITVANSSSMHFEFVRNKDGVVEDEVWIHHDSNLYL